MKLLFGENALDKNKHRAENVKLDRIDNDLQLLSSYGVEN